MIIFAIIQIINNNNNDSYTMHLYNKIQPNIFYFQYKINNFRIYM